MSGKTVFAVLGPWRGGTSLVAGVLSELGVYLGNDFVDAETGYCTFECTKLRQACVDGFDERPGMWCYYGSKESRAVTFSNWFQRAQSDAAGVGCELIGAKHPILCKLLAEFMLGCSKSGISRFKLIKVVRSEEDIHRSWTKPHWPGGGYWWPRPDREFVVKDLIASRDKRLMEFEHVEIDFNLLRAKPQETIEQLASDCKLSNARVTEAAKMVRQV